MKKSLNFCVCLVALFAISSSGYAQEAAASKLAGDEIVQPPVPDDAQPSVSDNAVPPVPVTESPSIATEIVTGNDCAGCGQRLSYSTPTPCDQFSAGQPTWVFPAGGCQCQPCCFPLAQPAMFPVTNCNSYDSIALASYQEGVPAESTSLVPQLDSVIVSPAAVDNFAAPGVITEAPVYQMAPVVDAAQPYNPAPLYNSVVPGVDIQGIPTNSGVPMMATDAVVSGCVGCGTASSGTMYSSPFNNRNSPSFVPRSMGRARGFVGGRILRRN